MRKSYILFISLIIFIALMIFDQIWLHILPPSLFWKLLVTALLIGGVVLAIVLLKAEWLEEKRLKKEKYYD